MTTLQGDYEPSPSDWVRDQVAEYEASGGQKANTLLDTGWPIIVLTMRGAKSGKVRKTALMRVEHGGEYALVASKGGAPEHPEWFYNLDAQRRREGHVVGARRRRLPALRRVPGEDGPADPRLRHHAQGRLTARGAQRASAKACTMAARHGTRKSSRSCAVLPSRTTIRSRAGQMVIVWPS
jgi:deazaflavin-dependent oxidoreductase (nitroreductase family)